MHTGADSTARAIAVVVPLLPVTRCVLWGELGVRSEAFRNEGVGVGVCLGVHVHAPGVYDDYGAFGEEFTVDPVVWNVVSAEYRKMKITPWEGTEPLCYHGGWLAYLHPARVESTAAKPDAIDALPSLSC